MWHVPVGSDDLESVDGFLVAYDVFKQGRSVLLDPDGWCVSTERAVNLLLNPHSPWHLVSLCIAEFGGDGCDLLTLAVGMGCGG